MVRLTGFEPARLPIRPSTVRVCQFRHSRTTGCHASAAKTLCAQQQHYHYTLTSAVCQTLSLMFFQKCINLTLKSREISGIIDHPVCPPALLRLRHLAFHPGNHLLTVRTVPFYHPPDADFPLRCDIPDLVTHYLRSGLIQQRHIQKQDRRLSRFPESPDPVPGDFLHLHSDNRLQQAVLRRIPSPSP